MTTNTEGAPDPHTGRFAIWIAGGLGIAAIVAYGSYQAQQRLAARGRAPEAAEVRTEAPPAPAQLIERADQASRALDVVALAALDRELEVAAARTTKTEDGTDLRIARASALAVRALEAAVRVHRTDDIAAKTELADALAQGRALTDALTREGAAPAVVGRIEARLDLAEGRDITLLHPVVLMAEYPDPELRLAALSRPLFSDAAVEDVELEELTVALRAASPQTGLTRLLLALALEASGDTTAAESQTQAVLAQTPGQPLAVALQAPPAPRGTAIEPDPKLDVGTEPEVEEPAVEEPENPEPAVEEPAVEEPEQPEPEKPEPTKKPPEPKKPEPKKPAEPKKPEPKKPAEPRAKKPKQDFDSLLAEGCDLVRKGEAAEGFKVLKEAHDLQPGGAKVTLCMAQAQDKLGRGASALALVDRVIRKQPKNKTALLLAARLEADQGNRSTAEDYYRRVLEIDPENAKAKSFLGQ